MTAVIDNVERKRALDPETSFIVQAPAGSGKTELLIQRYLVLLARVAEPEEILAITFTRKAAAEMTNRVLAAIARAAGDEVPEKPHEAFTWELARRVLSRDARKNWQLEKYPSRMRIMTIDSWCAGLTRQMPVLSGFGAPARITETPELLYARAARNTVAELESAGKWSGSVETLVRHLDNRLFTLEELLARMLPRRDQWLRHVARAGDPARVRRVLESALQSVIRETLSALRERIPVSCMEQIVDLCRFAAWHLEDADMDSPLANGRDLSGPPGDRPEDLPAWQAIAELLLTRDGQWRKRVDKRTGFPAPASAGADAGQRRRLERKKAGFKKLVAELSGQTGLDRAIDTVRRLPAPAYTENQWAVLEALSEMLVLAAGHLQAVFVQAGEVDFAEVGLRAQAALGGPDDPTDLALSLDYRISHILIDEFQDISISQFELLRRLTAGWSAGDGRSFFAVGDPMQSIYGFREAEVGLFLRAWQQGLDAHVPLKPVRLKSNFRSDAGIVAWLNAVFPAVFPETGDTATGAVPYVPAEAVLGRGTDPAVRIHMQPGADDEAEAAAVADCVRQAFSESPEGTVAILVRSRSHVKAVASALRRAEIRFSAVEIDSLAQRPLIRDLLSLTRALSHPADRVAWLAVLRAPWCGLTLKDLHALAGADHRSPVCVLMHDEERLSAMSEDGRARLCRVRSVLDADAARRGRMSLRRRVEGSWLALGGPATAVDPGQLADVPVYLDYLDARQGAEPVTDLEVFEQGVFSLFAAPDPAADPRLQVMTIHRAKGLEFDTVILPGLGKAPRREEPFLLLWQERPDAGEGESLLMAPISETGGQSDPTYGYIRRLQEIRRDQEARRLLYVAATRARKRLHLFGSLRLDKQGGTARPDPRSLLGVLWPALEQGWQHAGRDGVQAETRQNEEFAKEPDRGIRRLVAGWRPPGPRPDALPAGTVSPAVGTATAESVLPRYDWAGFTLRRVGIVVHRWLRIICEEGLENWDRQAILSVGERLRADLAAAGVCRDRIEEARKQAATALLNAVTDETGRWILSRHRQDACEYGVTGLIGREVVNAVIDRTFVDAHGVRWVIDYKSGVHGGGGLFDFLSREQQRYSLQMERYAVLMEKLDRRPVRLGLYFPMIPAWRCWPGRGRKA